MSILDTLAASSKRRCEKAKEKISFEEMKEKALAMPKKDFAFEKALQSPEFSMICECKKASPSKGLIAPDFDYVQIAKDYEKAGAACISVLTEPEYFLGSLQYLEEIVQAVSIPVLRKDFIVDPYMIYEARAAGADAVLLIVSLLSQKQLQEYLDICESLGLSVVVECHDAEEIQRACAAHARMIGVNNRNLKDFSVDLDNAARLKAMIPNDVLYISESGIRSGQDMKAARDMGADAVLIGEALMKADSKTEKAKELRSLL